MSRDLIRRYERRPWAMLAALLIAAILGSIAIPVQILLTRTGRAASAEQVEQNSRIAQQQRTDLCERMNLILAAHNIPAAPCPSPTPSPAR
jgi:hypothetical protein